MLLPHRQLFQSHIAKTYPEPPMLEIERAEGIYLYDTEGKEYIDLISGFSVSNLGHRNPHIQQAVEEQLSKYWHTTVYGEHVQSPQVLCAKALTDILPETLNTVYFQNSGSEAIEGAMKLAKRWTGRGDFVCAKHAYHGSTQGAMSLDSNEETTQRYRPLLPNIHHELFNSQSFIDSIDKNTAGVVIETIQAEGGVITPDPTWVKDVRAKCTETGALLILDEIQVGMGRTGSMFAFEHYDISPDILCLAKALGGGIPIGAFISSREIMQSLSESPILAHLTTFGGHPVSCAAAHKTIQLFTADQKNLLSDADRKSTIYYDALIKHSSVTKINHKGLFMAVYIRGIDVREFIDKCLEAGVLTESFLFEPNAFRIAPPLIITDAAIMKSIKVITKILDELS